MMSLTKKEKTICEMILNGMTNREISKYLHRSPHTINSHLKNIYRKNKLKNRAQLCYTFCMEVKINEKPTQP
ncbi:helix-turn-helix domain-containing protein [Yersinia enterocolitica]|uniref:helix-turn-helix domain-containing protein n=2 Tax=Yersinia enterocolitica TaxID=630 RepID=UPI0009767322|nr:helix-turn-helix transcriptional regulator [Yersinia enterocolitica]